MTKQFLSGISVAIIAMALIGCAKRVPKEEAVAKGQKALAEGRWEESVALLSDAAAGYPDDPIVHYNLGMALLNAGDFDKAEKTLVKAAELSQADNDTSALEALACARRKKGDLQGAVGALNRAVQLAGRRPRLLAEIAACKMDQGYLGEASQLIQEASVSDDPQNPDPVVLFNDAVLHSKEAKLDVTRAADRFVKFILVADDRAEEFGAQKQDAIKRLRELDKLRPAHIRARIDELIAVAVNPATPSDKALKAAAEAAALDQSNIAALGILAMIAEQQGNADLASRIRRRGRILYPGVPEFAE